ncbi:MAG: SHOCT-like domain-containing protein, partial [Caldilineaceae bacterium]
QSIESDALFSGVAGNLTVENVADDLNVSNVRGSVRVSAADDISLRLIVQPGFTYSAQAGSDLVCRIQSDAAVLVDLGAGEDLHVRRLVLPEPLKGKRARFALNGGEGATLTLVAGNDLSLVGLSLEELGDLGADLSFDIGLRAAEFVQQFASQFEAQVGAIAKQMDEKITNLGNTEEVATRIQERILAAARKAEEKITEAMKRMETRQREADKRQASAPWAGGWNASWTAAPSSQRPMRPPEPPAPPAPPAPSAPPVTEQERMSVLKMVSEGKISVEQAEKLRAALNGTTSGPGSSAR